MPNPPVTPVAWHLTRRFALPVILLSIVLVCGSFAVPAPPGAPSDARLVSWADRAPFGSLDHAYIVPGGLHVWGWDIEPDDATSAVRTYGSVDGKWVTSLRSDHYRADVAKAHPNAGGHHGVGGTIPVPQGKHTVCVVARNTGPGKKFTLGCRTRTFEYGPIGKLIGVTAAPGALHVRGWDMDADNPKAALPTTIKVDGVAHIVTANVTRSGIADRLKGAGSHHGFRAYIPVPQGKHTVCVTADNIGYGNNTNLGCQTFRLDESPVGRFTSLTTENGELRARGWAVDPDNRTEPSEVRLQVDGGPEHTVHAADSRSDITLAGAGREHGFDTLIPAGEGTHTVCGVARNVSYGHDSGLGCRTTTLTFRPTAYLFTPHATATGISVGGWASDPDTSSPIKVKVVVDHVTRTVALANQPGARHDGHRFAATVPATSGAHNVCAVGINAGRGHRNSAWSCRTITLALSPLGGFGHLTRAQGSDGLQLRGWALDPDTKSPIDVAVSVDGTTTATVRANADRPDVAASYPGMGDAHGIDATVAADDGEHHVCLTAKNVAGGSDTPIGCLQINAVDPVPPSSPDTVTATPGDESATVHWSQPTSDGGAPWSKYIVTAAPGGKRATVLAGHRSVTMSGLKGNTAYTFTVQTVNIAGASTGATSAPVTTKNGPAAQATPAPVSTSRYIRNVHGSGAGSVAAMRREGAADARANPSGHKYLQLLDIGGQDQYDGGVVLSAGVRFVSYGDLVRDVDSYVDGYHSAQRGGAPAVIALGTNNDMDVSNSSGHAWANDVVDPVRSHASGYGSLSIAGADDIEPGFRASYSSTKAWLTGFLAATKAQFVFNGSADGCGWSHTGSRCNNGWTMSGLYHLAGGASSSRIVDLPQVYNTTMGEQWKYISLTGLTGGGARIHFGGPLTEWTACDQSGSCGSMSGRTAWKALWNDLRSNSRLSISSLPYSTDLRIDYG